MKDRNSFNSGLGFGIAMGLFFIIQNLWDMPSITNSSVLKAVAVGILAGALSGLLFGWILGMMGKRLLKANKIDFLDADETVIFETPANHFKGIEGVGGKLCFTNKRLIFQSHNFNVQNHRLIIATHDISTVKRYKTMGIVNNGLIVTTTDGKDEKFVVQSADRWVRELNSNLTAAKLI